MAIQDHFTDVWTEDHPQAHIKLDISEENWSDLVLRVRYYVYKSADQAAAGKPPIDQGNITITKAEAPGALKLAGKAYRDALTEFLKDTMFPDGTLVPDSDPTQEE